jgi:hypothetical protein
MAPEGIRDSKVLARVVNAAVFITELPLEFVFSVSNYFLLIFSRSLFL